MNRIGALTRVLAVTTLFAAACGNAAPSAATSPTPANSCSASPCLALVTLRDSNHFVVRDLTDPSQPKTVADLGMVSWPTFVSATEVSYLADGGLVRASLSGGSSTVVFKVDDLMAYTWSPDGKTVAYLTGTSSGMTLHLFSASKDRVVGGPIPALPAVGCETEFCASADNWDFRLAYSPDGTRISMVESIANVSSFRLWTADGALVEHYDSQARPMSTWVGDSFYFQDAQGVEVWRNGVVRRFLPGVNWIRPKASPNSSEIVYETRDAQGWHHTFIAETSTAQVREIKKGGAEPVYLTSGHVWYLGERACAGADDCPAGYQVKRTGQAYIYDLAAGTETESSISFVSDVWPHAV